MFIPVRTNTEKYNISDIPAMIRHWNNRDISIRELPLIGSFKNAMRKQLLCEKTRHYSLGKGKSSRNHTQIQLELSPLKSHLTSYHIVTSPICSQCNLEPETPAHYFLKCPDYAVSRDEMIHQLRMTVDKLGIDFNNEKQIIDLRTQN